MLKQSFLLVLLLLCYFRGNFNFNSNAEMAGRKILSAEFEVFGIVQGVFFRKSTAEQATKLGVRGWCMNTRDDTVKGVIEGEVNAFNEMKHWLTNVGSSQSRIDKATFSETTELSDFSLPAFEVRRFPKK